MRWLSSVAVLVYLSLLCSSTGWAVHDARIAPLADSQLLLLAPSVNHFSKLDSSNEDEPPAIDFAPVPARFAQLRLLFSLTLIDFCCTYDVFPYSSQLARAPPSLSSGQP